MNYGKDVIVNREAEQRCARVREPLEIVLNPDRFLLDRLYSVK
jgi:hypothetical protein